MVTRQILAAVFLMSITLTVDAQSNVRPASRLVRIPDMGAKLFAPGSFWSKRSTELEALPYAWEFSPLDAGQSRSNPNGFTHLELDASFHPAANLEGSGGDVSTSRASWAAIFGERVDGESAFAVTIEAEASFYDFGRAEKLKAGSSDPINDVYETRVGVLIMEDPLKSMSWFSSAEIGMAGEDDADLGEAITVGVTGGVRKQVADDLSVSVGIIGRSRLEDSAWLFPYIGFDWRIADRIKLLSNGSRVGALIEFSDSVDFELGAEYAIRQYRLNEFSSLPGGIISDEDISASAILGWSPSDRIKLQLETGVSLWRELSSFSDRGVKQAELETEVKEFVGIRLSVTL